MTSSESLPSSAPSEAYPPASVAWYVVGLLTFANLFAFLDRLILALLITPIKADLSLTDTQISLLLGLAFALLYSLLGIPVGRLADRFNRRTILAAGMAIWCLATAGCGLARNFVTLFIGRLGIGVGQSVLSPCALSLIADHFPRESRARAVSIYSTGIGLGAGLSFILGGQLVGFVTEADPFVLPFFGELAAWQTVFMIVGLPGLIVVALLMTVSEPTRKEKIASTSGGDAPEVIPIPQVIKYMGDRWQAFATLFCGMAAVVILGYVFLSWTPAMLGRVFEWSPADIGLGYGLVLFFSGPLGVIAGGWIADYLYNKGNKDAHLLTVLIGLALFNLPFGTIAPLVSNPYGVLAFMFLATLGAGISTTGGAAAMTIIVPNQMRGQLTAVYYFVIGLAGPTVGATLPALITDFVFADEMALPYSMAIATAVIGILGTIVLLVGRKAYNQVAIDAEQAQTQQ